MRAVAARAACPCHGSFDLLREVQPELELLARHDPSPRVRKAARHTLGDVLNLNIHEDARARRDERREARLAHRVHQARVRGRGTATEVSAAQIFSELDRRSRLALATNPFESRRT